MAEPPNVRLQLPNKPENILLVREMLTGVAETIDLEREELDDIRTAVTEACNNVVLHAYEGAEGPLEVKLYARPQAIEVVVRDHGIGLQPPAAPTDGATSIGLGLPIIQALARRVELRDASDKGSEVWMEFGTASTHALDSHSRGEFELPPPAQIESISEVEASIVPPDLARTVLPRVLSVLAAHARFSTDRIGDTQLLADALAAQASKAVGDGHLSVAVHVKPRNLELRLGPLDAGGAQQLIAAAAVEGIGPVVEALADDHRVLSSGSSEVLALRLSDRRG
jgi:serine/threonine-protein kinase RsbW